MNTITKLLKQSFSTNLTTTEQTKQRNSTDRVCNFWAFAFINAMNCNKVDGAFASSFVDDRMVPFPKFLIQHKIFHSEWLTCKKYN